MTAIRTMTHKLISTAGLFTLMALLSGQVHTAPAAAEPFTKDRFDELTTTGELVLVVISATWCPTCAQQRKILDTYTSAHPDAPLRLLNVDFDDQKEWVSYFKAPRQSTLILYAGTTRLWFTVAETRAELITQMLDDAIKEHGK